MKKIIPLLLVLTSCGLYVDNSYNYSYSELLNYGLEEINYNNPMDIIVTGDRGRLMCYEVEGSAKSDKWELREIVYYNSLKIESYISTRGSSIILSPIY